MLDRLLRWLFLPRTYSYCIFVGVRANSADMAQWGVAKGRSKSRLIVSYKKLSTSFVLLSVEP